VELQCRLSYRPRLVLPVCNAVTQLCRSGYLVSTAGRVLGYEWRRRPPDTDDSFEYGREVVMDSQQGVTFGFRVQRRDERTFTVYERHVAKCDRGPWSWTESFAKRGN
jgi:hypothetical protein